MKTTTYLRVSLLIPFLLWGVCLLFFMTVSTSPTNELLSGNRTTLVDWIFLFIAFYLFGIIIWILPYALLALLLLSVSFISQAQTAMKMFALSPIVMTILTIIWVNLLGMGTPETAMLSSSSAINYQDFINSNILFGVVALLWGYICVGIGFGIYRWFQHSRIVRDESIIAAELRPSNQFE